MRLARFALVALLAAVPLLAHDASDPHADSYVLRLGDVTFMNGQVMSVDTLKQDKLGEMQDRLSRQVEQQLAALADQCIRNGIAKEVRR